MLVGHQREQEDGLDRPEVRVCFGGADVVFVDIVVGAVVLAKRAKRTGVFLSSWLHCPLLLLLYTTDWLGYRVGTMPFFGKAEDLQSISYHSIS